MNLLTVILKIYTFTRVSRFNDRTHLLWEESCDKFFTYLLSHVSISKIIVHETYWADHYINEEYHLCEYPNSQNIQRNNEVLERYYSYVRNKYPEIRFVSSNRVGSASHKWGLSPVHYTDEYYLDIFKQIADCKK
ncbi:DUF6270 domain-containing protein [Paenibacillus sp. FSL F4-0087]|uniref:DUF6270 domain-containing protein n=1 Tax=Paenibacillus sp. FSL F4-0087 TaxID=2921368 RepID=UPI0040407883